MIDDIKSYESVPISLAAALVTEENMEELSVWCGGDIRAVGSTGSKLLVVPSTEPDGSNAAPIGAYLAREDRTGKFKVYERREFEREFRLSPGHIELEDSEMGKDSTLYPDLEEVEDEGDEGSD